MRARLIILIVLGAGLALFYTFRTTPAAPVTAEVEDKTDENAKMLYLYDLDCPESPIEPEIDLSIYVDPNDGKNRIYYELSETHDFYVQSFKLEFWYMPEPDTTCEESPYCVEVPVDHYIKAGEVHEGCVDLNEAEIAQLGGDMGSTDNWGVQLIDFAMTKWCTENPKLLRREDSRGCDAKR